MNDHAYDISHLLDIESAAPAVPAHKPTSVRAAPSNQSQVAAMQAALERELLKAAVAHDGFIDEYLRDNAGLLPPPSRR